MDHTYCKMPPNDTSTWSVKSASRESQFQYIITPTQPPYDPESSSYGSKQDDCTGEPQFQSSCDSPISLTPNSPVKRNEEEKDVQIEEDVEIEVVDLPVKKTKPVKPKSVKTNKKQPKKDQQTKNIKKEEPKKPNKTLFWEGCLFAQFNAFCLTKTDSKKQNQANKALGSQFVNGIRKTHRTTGRKGGKRKQNKVKLTEERIKEVIAIIRTKHVSQENQTPTSPSSSGTLVTYSKLKMGDKPIVVDQQDIYKNMENYNEKMVRKLHKRNKIDTTEKYLDNERKRMAVRKSRAKRKCAVETMEKEILQRKENEEATEKMSKALVRRVFSQVKYGDNVKEDVKQEFDGNLNEFKAFLTAFNISDGDDLVDGGEDEILDKYWDLFDNSEESEEQARREMEAMEEEEKKAFENFKIIFGDFYNKRI